MGDHAQVYGDDRDGESRWERRERLREHQEHRVLAIRAGDALLDVGRHFGARGGKYAREAPRVLFNAMTWYMAAGLTWQGKVAWRMARVIHAATCRAGNQGAAASWPASSRRAALPPTRRWLELATAVERLTAEQGRPPSWTELGRELGIGASAVRELARRARGGGVVTFKEGQPRTIRVAVRNW